MGDGVVARGRAELRAPASCDVVEGVRDGRMSDGVGDDADE